MINDFDIELRDSKKRAAELPNWGASRIADTHAHLDMLEDPIAALVRAARAGLGLIVTLVNVDENFDNTRLNLENWRSTARDICDELGIENPVPEVRIIAGTHPHEAASFSKNSEARMRELLSDPRAVGIGEVGLDFYYDHSPRDVQRRVFAAQMGIAAELNLPVCLHLREAHEEAVTILRSVELPQAGIILHCFNLGPEVLELFTEFDPYVSFAGPLTFKKAEEVRASAALVAADRLLTETDCPFMTPEPLRGQKCEPAHVSFTAARLAEVRGLSLPELADLSFANARRIFKLGE